MAGAFSIGSHLYIDSAVHPRDIMDVGRCAARLTEFASVLEVPLISWPMSRLHARNSRSPPTTHNLRQSSSTSRDYSSFLAVSASHRLRSSSIHACNASHREYIVPHFSIRIIRSDFWIVHHFVVP